MRFKPDEIRQLIDAFLTDHGGIHVGQEKLLAPRQHGLHDNVDRQVLARLAQALGDGADVFVAIAKGDVGSDFVPQPLRRGGLRQNGARTVEHRAIEGGIGRVADQRGDEGHEFAGSR